MSWHLSSGHDLGPLSSLTGFFQMPYFSALTNFWRCSFITFKGSTLLNFSCKCAVFREHIFHCTNQQVAQYLQYTGLNPLPYVIFVDYSVKGAVVLGYIPCHHKWQRKLFVVNSNIWPSEMSMWWSSKYCRLKEVRQYSISVFFQCALSNHQQLYQCM